MTYCCRTLIGSPLASSGLWVFHTPNIVESVSCCTAVLLIGNTVTPWLYPRIRGSFGFACSCGASARVREAIYHHSCGIHCELKIIISPLVFVSSVGSPLLKMAFRRAQSWWWRWSWCWAIGKTWRPIAARSSRGLLPSWLVVVASLRVMMMSAWSKTNSTNSSVLLENAKTVSGFNGPGYPGRRKRIP